MLVEIAIGDAYGAGFEYVNADVIEQYNDLSKYVQHPRHTNIQPGQYTDDTQMSIAIAEAMLNDCWTPEGIAHCFVTAFHRDRREGYAQGFHTFLSAIQTGNELLEKIQPESNKSGAAMRAAPIGYFPTPQEVIDKSRIQAAITHNTPEGIDAAIAAALMSHYFIYAHGDKKDLGKFIKNYVAGDWDVAWQGKVKAQGWMSVRAAITAIEECNKMSTILQKCISYTGDVDTVAAIALGAASCSMEIEHDLPESLLENLEDSPYGRLYLAELDEQLAEKFL